MSETLVYTIPLESGRAVLHLPRELSKADARKLARFTEAVAFEDADLARFRADRRREALRIWLECVVALWRLGFGARAALADTPAPAEETR